MKRHLFILMMVILGFRHHDAAAFWGTPAANSASGLNVTTGFDVNTITTVTGTVTTTPEHNDQHTVMTVAARQGTVTVVLGPWWYWQRQTMTITQQQKLAITGSLAQGKDGVLYLFAQRLANPDTGETVILRSESGKPLWSGSGSGNRNGFRGGGNRGGGMRGGRR